MVALFSPVFCEFRKERGVDGLEIGLTGAKEMTVQRHHFAGITGNIGAAVLSTHWVILFMGSVPGFSMK